jgi:hypothetical protein
MRTDETGSPCPGTLGEYRQLCAALGGEDCDAVRWLDSKIAEDGKDMPVLVPDYDMRAILMPRLITIGGKRR